MYVCPYHYTHLVRVPTYYAEQCREHNKLRTPPSNGAGKDAVMAQTVFFPNVVPPSLLNASKPRQCLTLKEYDYGNGRW